MSQKITMFLKNLKLKNKKFTIRIISMLVWCGLTALKLLRWKSIYEDLDWIIDDFLHNRNGGFLALITYYGWCLSAIFALITIWLRGKAQTVLGVVFFNIAGSVAFVEIVFFAWMKLGTCIGGNIFAYVGLDPLITIGFIAIIAVSVLKSDGNDKKISLQELLVRPRLFTWRWPR